MSSLKGYRVELAGEEGCEVSGASEYIMPPAPLYTMDHQGGRSLHGILVHCLMHIP